MGKMCTVTINGQRFGAQPGDVLLDAALINGVDIPHDCRSGQCGSCLVRLLSGYTLAGEGSEPGTIHACQARVLSNLEVAFDDVPAVGSWPGEVAAVRELTWDVTEVAIVPKRPVAHLPGQYLKVQFRGFPQRAYSPAPPLDTPVLDGAIRFHVRRIEGGCVSSRLGTDIVPGHPVKLRGPYGSAHFRRLRPNRLVLVSGGTGFAPLWSIADAAMREWPQRHLVLVVGARSLQSLYMAQALERLSTCPNAVITIVTEEPHALPGVIRVGRPTDYLPQLSEHDLVYAAGPPGLVEAVRATAVRARAAFHADPFVANGPSSQRLFDRLMRWRSATRSAHAALDGVGADRAGPSLGRILREIDDPEPVLEPAFRSFKV